MHLFLALALALSLSLCHIYSLYSLLHQELRINLRTLTLAYIYTQDHSYSFTLSLMAPEDQGPTILVRPVHTHRPPVQLVPVEPRQELRLALYPQQVVERWPFTKIPFAALQSGLAAGTVAGLLAYPYWKRLNLPPHVVWTATFGHMSRYGTLSLNVCHADCSTETAITTLLLCS